MFRRTAGITTSLVLAVAAWSGLAGAASHSSHSKTPPTTTTTTTVAPPTGPTNVLLIVAGQSNAMGVESYATDPYTGVDYLAPPYTNGADDSDQLVWTPSDILNSSLTPVPLDTPQTVTFPGYNPSQIFGPEIGIARQLYTDLGLSATIVKVTYEGISLATDWSPSGAGLDMFPELISTVQGQIASDAANGITDVIGGFYWYQGESDATNKQDAANYKMNLKRFILAVRSNLPMGTAPFVIAQESIDPLVNVDVAEGLCTAKQCKAILQENAKIRNADVAMQTLLPDVVTVDTSDLARMPDTGLHLTNLSELTLGARMATASEPDLESAIGQ